MARKKTAKVATTLRNKPRTALKRLIRFTARPTQISESRYPDGQVGVAQVHGESPSVRIPCASCGRHVGDVDFVVLVCDRGDSNGDDFTSALMCCECAASEHRLAAAVGRLADGVLADLDLELDDEGDE